MPSFRISLLGDTQEDTIEQESNGDVSGAATSGIGKTNIPASPTVTSRYANSVDRSDDGYDSDGNVGPFYDAVTNEGPSELEEPTAKELGADGLDPSEDTNNEGDDENVGQFVDITEDD